MTDYSELKQKAEAAKTCDFFERNYDTGGLLYDTSAMDYIAAANPAVVLAILAELDALRAANKMFTYGRGRQA